MGLPFFYGKFFFHTVCEIVTFTPPLKTNILFPVCYSNFHYPYNQTLIFPYFFWNFLSPPECSALLSPPEFSAPPLSDLSSWSHGSDLGLEITKFWCLKFGFDCICEGLDDFVKVLLGLIFFWGFGWFWLRLEIIKFGFFDFEVILVSWDKK